MQSAFWKAIKSNARLQRNSDKIGLAPRDKELPLSFGQERLWFIDQLQQNSTAHNLRSAYRLTGELNIWALQKSFQEIINRHEVFRTVFPAIEGKPKQIIADKLEIAVPVIDLSNLIYEQQESEIKKLAAQEAQQSFDLSRLPLLKIKLLKLSESDYVLLRTTHHLVFDMWSDSILMRELAVLYEDYSQNKTPALTPLSIQYIDFACFQRNLLQGEELENYLIYWRNQLKGNLRALQLPVDNTLTQPSYRGATQYITINKDITDALKKLSRQQGVSLFVVLLASFKTLLYQYSQQEDIILCSPVAGRYRIETKKIIGYFNNLVLIRTQLNHELSFKELISKLSEISLRAHEHQDLPLQQLSESLNISGNILSRVMFALQNVPNVPLKMADIDIKRLDIEEGIANFDLSLSIREKKDGSLIGVLRYKTELFQEITIQKFLDNFNLLLETVSGNPDIKLGKLPIFKKICNKKIEISYIEPETELEKTIAEVWQKVLKIEKIGIKQNFFDIGGSSLAIIKVCSLLQEKLKQNINVVELFKYPTICSMAEYITHPVCTKQKELDVTALQDRTDKQRQFLLRQKQLMNARRK